MTTRWLKDATTTVVLCRLVVEVRVLFRRRGGEAAPVATNRPGLPRAALPPVRLRSSGTSKTRRCLCRVSTMNSRRSSAEKARPVGLAKSVAVAHLHPATVRAKGTTTAVLCGVPTWLRRVRCSNRLPDTRGSCPGCRGDAVLGSETHGLEVVQRSQIEILPPLQIEEPLTRMLCGTVALLLPRRPSRERTREERSCSRPSPRAAGPTINAATEPPLRPRPSRES